MAIFVATGKVLLGGSLNLLRVGPEWQRFEILVEAVPKAFSPSFPDFVGRLPGAVPNELKALLDDSAVQDAVRNATSAGLRMFRRRAGVPVGDNPAVTIVIGLARKGQLQIAQPQFEIGSVALAFTQVPANAPSPPMSVNSAWIGSTTLQSPASSSGGPPELSEWPELELSVVELDELSTFFNVNLPACNVLPTSPIPCGGLPGAFLANVETRPQLGDCRWIRAPSGGTSFGWVWGENDGSEGWQPYGKVD